MYPHWVQAAVTQSIIQETRAAAGSRILEIGVGTGRITLPLLERGLSVVGVDLSLPMLNEFARKAAERQIAPELARADANYLPLPAAAFDTAYAVHVFHLVANWRSALDEALRVLKPGGQLLVNLNERDPNTTNRRIRAHLAELLRPLGLETRRPGVQSSAELKSELERRASTRRVHVAKWNRLTSPARVIDDIARQTHSGTWAVPGEILATLVPQLRTWSQAKFGDLDKQVQEPIEFNWLIAQK